MSLKCFLVTEYFICKVIFHGGARFTNHDTVYMYLHFETILPGFMVDPKCNMT